MSDTITSLQLPRVLTSVRETQDFVRQAQRQGKRVGVVPTMGALHAGHLSLVERSKRDCDVTIVTIYVNPKQFGVGEDFTRYPRELEQDLARLAPLGVDLVFAPTDAAMYPSGFATHVEVGGITAPWEGACRPGHFRGVTTVVMKLLQIVPADAAFFGQKDYQQALIVKRMATDLNLVTEIVVCPIVREPDGLAMSSRNVYLSLPERQAALVLSRSLQRAKAMFDAGERDAAKIRDEMKQLVAAEPLARLEYATIADAETLAELDRIDSIAVALISAKVGTTRLIDNEIIAGS